MRTNSQFQPNKIFLRTASEVIKKLRKERNFFQEKLAECGGFDVRTLQDIEAKATNLSLGMFYCIAKAFELRPHELLKIIDNDYEVQKLNQ